MSAEASSEVWLVGLDRKLKQQKRKSIEAKAQTSCMPVILKSTILKMVHRSCPVPQPYGLQPNIYLKKSSFSILQVPPPLDRRITAYFNRAIVMVRLEVFLVKVRVVEFTIFCLTSSGAATGSCFDSLFAIVSI